MVGMGSGAACEACRYFEDHKVNGGASHGDAGLCRYNPPVTQPDASGRGLWPVVTAADWCGHFSAEQVPAE